MKLAGRLLCNDLIDDFSSSPLRESHEIELCCSLVRIRNDFPSDAH
jgi:hypothetical protein